MKPTKYSITITPNKRGKKRKYSISRINLIVLIISISLIIGLFILLILNSFLNMKQYYTLAEQNKKYIAERVQIMELMQDLNRIEQMDKLIRKTLGTELQLENETTSSDSISINRSGPLSEKTNVSYIENIPSFYPVEGYITQRVQTEELFRDQNHYGIDIAVKEGESVYATAAGFVVYSGWTYDFGNYIILYHGDDYFSVYGHHKNNFVQTREFVKRGDVIGTTGDTGIATGPHLHFEIWKDGAMVNPLELFPSYKQNDLSVN